MSKLDYACMNSNWFVVVAVLGIGFGFVLPLSSGFHKGLSICLIADFEILLFFITIKLITRLSLYVL